MYGGAEVMRSVQLGMMSAVGWALFAGGAGRVGRVERVGRVGRAGGDTLCATQYAGGCGKR